MAFELKTWVPLTPAEAADLNQLRDNLIALDQHTHSGAAGDGSADVHFGMNYLQILPFFPTSESGWSTITLGSVAFTATMDTDATAQGNSISFSAALRTDGGGWRMDLLHGKGPDYGIITVDVDGDVIGTIDCYAGAESFDNESNISGASIGSIEVNAPCVVTFTMSTKNGSSTGYRARIQFITFRLV